jgi:hypothetical protein
MAKNTNDFNRFVSELKKTHTEEDVKNCYAKHFRIAYNTADRHDLYTPQVFFEFKFDKNFDSLKTKATILAQTLYYIHRLKYGFTNNPIPPKLCLADKNEAILTETSIWKDFYTDSSEKYDWDLAPSIPDRTLVNDIIATESIRTLHVFKIQYEPEYEIFSSRLAEALNAQISLGYSDKKIITEDNFEGVFEYWNKTFGDDVRNGLKTSRYFFYDIQKGRSFYREEEGKVYFDFGNGDIKSKKILAKDYEYFWSLYEKISDIDTIRSILAKIDRLSDETMRRFHGEFFTPVRFAKKALDYLETTIQKSWWESGEYRLWDMAAGTGNLEYHLHSDALPYCYLSSLYVEDVEHCKRLFPNAAGVFQYDYLNDDIGNLFTNGQLQFDLTWKLPEKLRNDLSNPKTKWIILINPPFATAQKAGTGHGDSKEGVSDTKIRKVMHDHNLGEVSRELFAQFLFRIKYEFKGETAHLGLFSKIKYINANNDQKFRDTIFQYEFERGFVFSSVNFSGTSRTNQFPVGFLIWNLKSNRQLESQEIRLDVFNEEVEKVGTKSVSSDHRDNFLSKWIDRPPANVKFPPLGSAIELKIENQDRRDRVSRGFLASLMCKGNEFVNQNATALMSAPYVSAGALSVIPENFEQAMVVHAVRRIPKATWLNDRDQFLSPQGELPREFIIDCTVWNLYSNSNQTAAMKDVKYEGEIYQIDNHFFPFLKSEVKSWKITDSDIQNSLSAGEDRFVAKWLTEKNLSEEAKIVLDTGRRAWMYYFEHLNELKTTKFKIETWDAGWWQVRNALVDRALGEDLLKELKAAHDRLKSKILPQIYEHKFL